MSDSLPGMLRLRKALADMLAEQQHAVPPKLVTIQRLGHAINHLDGAIAAERTYEEAT